MREVLVLVPLLVFSAIFPMDSLADGVSPSEAKQLRDEVRGMFYHAFDGYMQHAFPLDELRPLTCKGEDTLGGYALTLIDSLDTLALLGDRERFGAAVEWIGRNVRFDIDKTVSVFETTIRILGGLLSAHLIASDYATGMNLQSYDDKLLHLAEDLAQRLLPAFDTPTGIPFGSVNLLRGVDENESKITSTAGGGTLTLEFGVLSRLTNNPIFEEVTKNAVRGIWAQRSKINLVGAHINVFTGEWTQKDAGIGTSIDSFYEYLLKAYLLFGDEEYLFMFQEAYKAVMHYLHHDPWYVEVNMYSAATVWPLFNSLQAFWPGLQVLAGDIDPAVRTHAAFFSVWKKYGFTPEGFNLATFSIQHGQKSYPLRPELIESTYWLFKATRDARYLDVGRDMLASFQYAARCPCGYCHIADVESHKQDDHMESFFLAETVKYLWLLFDLAVGPDNLVENGPYKYIFSTEGHLLPATPEISLVSEHCSYLGAFCKGDRWKKHGPADISFDYQETNDTQLPMDRYPSVPSLKTQDAFSVSGFIKGSCPGLTHGQKFGISYVEEKHETHEGLSVLHPESQRHSVIVISNPTTIHSINADESDSSNNILGRNDESKTLMPVTDEKDVNASSQDEMQEVQDTRRAYTPLNHGAQAKDWPGDASYRTSIPSNLTCSRGSQISPSPRNVKLYEKGEMSIVSPLHALISDWGISHSHDCKGNDLVVTLQIKLHKGVHSVIHQNYVCSL